MLDGLRNTALALALVVTLMLAGLVACRCIHCNELQEFQITQSLGGAIELHSDGGYYWEFFPRKWVYPKKVSAYFSNVEDEGRDQRAIVVKFKNKGEGTISCNVIYSLFIDRERISRMHEYFGGNLELIDQKVLSKLKDIIQSSASNINSSDAIENREAFIADVRKGVIDNPELMEMGIGIEQIDVTDIDFDAITRDLFKKQQEADLQKKTAEAEKDRAVMETEKVKANAEKEIAEAEGRARVEAITETTAAEKKKKLAEIEAEKKVAVAELQKKEETVRAEKERGLALIALEMEKTKLETARIVSEQIAVEAKAKEQRIRLAGDITEQERFQIEAHMKTRVGIAHELAKGLSGVRMPSVVMFTGEGKAADAVSSLVRLMTVQKAQELVPAAGK